jgi:hypothetical protein
VSFEKGLVPFRSQAWRCGLPDPNTYIEDSIGTSETRGIVGGISQPVLAAQSEAIERALGDALVLAFSQILDMQPDVGVVLLRGPVFPKTLGRFLSLRPSDRMIIAWIMALGESKTYPIPFLFPLTWYEERSIAWDSENLINSFTHPDRDPVWAVEFLNTGDNESAVQNIKDVLDNFKVGERGTPREFWCAEKMICPADAEEYVLSIDGPAIRCPEWLQHALTTDGPLGVPTMEGGLGRNLIIFPWKTNGPL